RERRAATPTASSPRRTGSSAWVSSPCDRRYIPAVVSHKLQAVPEPVDRVGLVVPRPNRSPHLARVPFRGRGELQRCDAEEFVLLAKGRDPRPGRDEVFEPLCITGQVRG